ncbi:hypothetical protein ACLB2K_050846 [Fragaria x ananassa]
MAGGATADVNDTKSNSSSTTTAPWENSNHTLYLHHSDQPTVVLVTQPLMEDNFSEWTQSMSMALKIKNKIGFVLGTQVKPTVNLEEQQQWERCDTLVKTWLIASMSKPISGSVKNCKTSRDVWLDLQERFGQTNTVQLFNIENAIHVYTQGSDSVTTFFTKLKSLWDERDTICDMQKGYKLLDLIETERTFVSRDISFHEDVFHYHEYHSSRVSALPTTTANPPSHPSGVSSKTSPSCSSNPTSVSFLSSSAPIDPPASFGFPSSPPLPDVAVSDALAPEPLAIDTLVCNSPLPPASATPPRRSSRPTKLPHFLHDYHVEAALPTRSISSSSPSTCISHSLSTVFSYNQLSPSYKAFAANLMLHKEPQSYSQAVQHQEWRDAMRLEIQALEQNRTWSLVPLPPHKHPIGCKWVYKIKLHPDGSVERYKARLVAKGYSQIEGVDYRETFVV